MFLPFPAPVADIPVATHVRGSVLVSSVRGLRAKQLFDRYMGFRDVLGRERILATTASSWVPLQEALEHYFALDKLRLSNELVEELGAASGRVINASFLGVVVRMTHEAGATTPWSALANTGRLVTRTWKGSGCRVMKLGPKEARFEWVGQPLVVSPYYRLAYGAFMSGVFTLFCKTSIVREIPRLTTTTSICYRCSWV